MPETTKCPDCGHPNPPGATSCEACNFPFSEHAPIRGLAPEDQAALDPIAPTGSHTSRPDVAPIPRPPRRPPRPRPMATQSVSLWLIFGFIAAAAVIYVAVKANVDRAQPPVEGSNANQQQTADQFRAQLD